MTFSIIFKKRTCKYLSLKIKKLMRLSEIFSKRFLDSRIYLIMLLVSSLFFLGNKYQSCSQPKPLPMAPRQIQPGAIPPSQPQLGPGGTDYFHSDVIANIYGEGGQQYWIFEPNSPKPDSASLIIFLHGWGVMKPEIYGAWIYHLVLRGNIVVYPQYQESLKTPLYEMMENVIKTAKDSIEELNGSEHVVPELNNVAVVGHSMGGVFAANLAVLAESEGLPVPKALMCVQPAISSPIYLEDYSNIPGEVMLLVLVGEEDEIVLGENIADIIFDESSQVPLENKNFVMFRSDYYGTPPLVADHGAPTTLVLNKDALDYYCFWKLFDGLTDAAFYDGKNREYALGNTSEQRFMGYWSDDTPVKELVVIK